MTVSPVGRRTRSNSSAELDGGIGRCARPSCRKEFRRVVAAGRPSRYCEESCRQKARTERKSAEAVLRHADDLRRQARADLDVFDADDPDAVLAGDQLARAREALAAATAALRYIAAQSTPGIKELADLVSAVAPLVAGDRSASVA